jgi:hypothetical protein
MTYTTQNGGVPGSTTPIEKGQGAPSTLTPKTDTNSADFRIDGAIQQAGDGKAIANQIARLSLAGHVVHKGQSGDYLVSKYGMTRYCQDFTELVAFAQKLGVK